MARPFKVINVSSIVEKRRFDHFHYLTKIHNVANLPQFLTILPLIILESVFYGRNEQNNDEKYGIHAILDKSFIFILPIQVPYSLFCMKIEQIIIKKI